MNPSQPRPLATDDKESLETGFESRRVAESEISRHRTVILNDMIVTGMTSVWSQARGAGCGCSGRVVVHGVCNVFARRGMRVDER